MSHCQQGRASSNSKYPKLTCVISSHIFRTRYETRDLHQMSKEIIDSHLIKVLHTLLTESSVSRTATLLGQSQPTVSVALRKLREMTGDPLLVRSGSRMVPTSHALTLIEPAAQALNNIAAILHPTSSFNP